MQTGAAADQTAANRCTKYMAVKRPHIFYPVSRQQIHGTIVPLNSCMILESVIPSSVKTPEKQSFVLCLTKENAASFLCTLPAD